MIALFIILGIVVWFILGTLGYIIYQKFGNENVFDEFGLFSLWVLCLFVFQSWLSSMSVSKIS